MPPASRERALSTRDVYKRQGEDRGSLRNSPDIAGKTEVSQIIQKFFYETAFGPEVFDIRFGEMQILDIIDNLL